MRWSRRGTASTASPDCSALLAVRHTPKPSTRAALTLAVASRSRSSSHASKAVSVSALMVGERSATPGWPRREPRCGWGPKKLPRHVVTVTKVQAIRRSAIVGSPEPRLSWVLPRPRRAGEGRKEPRDSRTRHVAADPLGYIPYFFSVSYLEPREVCTSCVRTPRRSRVGICMSANERIAEGLHA